MNKKIGIDLDEVLTESVDFGLKITNNKINQQRFTRENITRYYFHEIPGFEISVEDSINWFRNIMRADVDLIIQPVEGALEKLSEYKNKGYNFNIITARDGDLFAEYTNAWIDKYFKDIFDIIYFANHFADSKSIPKSEFCLNHGIKTMVEDNPDYALELATNGVKTYLLEKPWNITSPINHPNIIRVKSWDEINF